MAGVRRGSAAAPPRSGASIDPLLFLVTGVVLVVGVTLAAAFARAGLPVLVAFLGLGMLLGPDGPGGIAFDDPDLARTIGTIGLVAILWEGGLTSSWRDIRPVVVPAALLATLGVVVTAGIVGVAAQALFDLTWPEALLLGAVVGSTDAAAVFATLRATNLRRRIAGLLEAESGLNDPIAVALTIGLIEWVTGDGYGAPDLALAVIGTLLIGLVIGGAIAVAAVWAIRLLPPGTAPFTPVLSVAVAAIAFGLPEVLGGSGLLSVYVVALAVGNTPSPARRSLAVFDGGLAFLAQIALFVTLGLLVFPSELGAVAVPALLLTAVLIAVARPVATWLCTLRLGFTRAERTLLAWSGLRGAVPIILATFVLSEGVGASDTIFNAVFFVVLVSAAIQGPLLQPLARRLGLAGEARAFYEPPLEIGAIGGADIIEFSVGADDVPAGRRVRELGLPRTSLLAVVLRDGEAIPPRGRTQLETGDRLYILTRADDLAEVERVVEGWRATPA